MARRTNLRRRGNAWVVHFRVNGKQVWRSFKTKDEAELFLARYLPKGERQKYSAPVRVTFLEAANEWVRHGENEGGKRGPWKPSTRRDYRSALKTHFLGTEKEPGWLRTMPLERITAASIERWRSEALGEGMSRRSAAKLTAILHAVFERARKAYGLPANPVDEVEPIAVDYDSQVHDFYSPEEIQAIVRAAASEQDGAVFLTAAFTGLRRGELLGLRWRDVDFVGQVLRVEHSYDYETGLVTPKSHKMRSVPMSPEVAQSLARRAARPLRRAGRLRLRRRRRKPARWLGTTSPL